MHRVMIGFFVVDALIEAHYVKSGNCVVVLNVKQRLLMVNVLLWSRVKELVLFLVCVFLAIPTAVTCVPLISCYETC